MTGRPKGGAKKTPERITDKKGRPITSVLILINRLSFEAMKRPNNDDLGAFHRSLAINLCSGAPDESEAGKFARELLESAKSTFDKRIERSEKGNAAKREKNASKADPEQLPETWDGESPF
jgi:hypothetical protein